jgi:hypothetical protein
VGFATDQEHQAATSRVSDLADFVIETFICARYFTCYIGGFSPPPRHRRSFTMHDTARHLTHVPSSM